MNGESVSQVWTDLLQLRGSPSSTWSRTRPTNATSSPWFPNTLSASAPVSPNLRHDQAATQSGSHPGLAHRLPRRRVDRPRRTVRVPTLRSVLHSADPVLGGRVARHRTTPGASRRVDSPQRRGECGSVLRDPREDSGGVVLRLHRTTATTGHGSTTGTGPPHRDRRTVSQKWHRQFVAVIVDHDHGCVFDVLESREKATALAYLKQQKEQGVLEHVEEVMSDMWDAYVEAAREAFGTEVRITIDRFHVMKNF